MTITSIERVEAVLDHKIPDRIPIGLHNFLMACIMHENGVCAEAEAMGCEIRYTQDVPPHVAVPVIQSFDDVDKLTVPDPETTFPLNELIKATRIIVSETRGRVFVNGRSDQGTGCARDGALWTGKFSNSGDESQIEVTHTQTARHLYADECCLGGSPAPCRYCL